MKRKDGHGRRIGQHDERRTDCTVDATRLPVEGVRRNEVREHKRAYCEIEWPRQASGEGSERNLGEMKGYHVIACCSLVDLAPAGG